MKGYTHTITCWGLRDKRKEWHEPVPLAYLNAAVGGSIALIPYFNEYIVDGEKHRCIAYCNEEGKLQGYSVNVRAQQLWEAQCTYALDDHLVGDVIVLYGDDEFMEAL